MENYCKYCTDNTGNLKPRDEILKGIAGWFKTWQPEIDDAKAAKRAEAYMQSMPAWAEE